MTGAFWGISIPDTVDTTTSQVELKPSYTDKAEVMKVLKDFKTARFKLFKTSEEAASFSQSSSPTTSVTPDLVTISSPKPSESCTFRSLTPQEDKDRKKAWDPDGQSFQRSFSSQGDIRIEGSEKFLNLFFCSRELFLK